jgi:hypothetical protein
MTRKTTAIAPKAHFDHPYVREPHAPASPSFSEDGELLDGQHRLHAVLGMGRPPRRPRTEPTPRRPRD